MKKLITLFVVFAFIAVLVGCSTTMINPTTAATTGTTPTTAVPTSGGTIGTTTSTSGNTSTSTTAATTTVSTTAPPTTTVQTTSTSLANVQSDTGLDPNVVGIVDIVLWSGSGATLRNIGKQNYTPDQLLAQNEAAAYAVAKAFNQIYPNVVINGYFKSGDPGGAWNQVLDTYRDDEGRFPSVWASVDLSGDVSRGIVADLTRFKDDPLYKQLNPSVMSMMNYYGFQAGLPQYILPWGIFVNKALADRNGIETPSYMWNIQEYTQFTSNFSNDPTNQFYGADDTPTRLINTGVNTMWKSLFNYKTGNTFLDMNSNEVRAMVPYIAEWITGSFQGQWNIENSTNPSGTGPVATLGSQLGWSYNRFRLGYLLTLEYDPWMMGDCAETNPNWWAVCNSPDWDIYPRPSTPYVDNHIGLVLDPMAVYNFCLDDGDLSCTPEEELKIQIAYTFAIFWAADSRSFEARANQLFYDTGSKGYSSALNDSVPVVQGQMFVDQMAYWYTPVKHQRMGASYASWTDLDVDGEQYSFTVKISHSGEVLQLMTPADTFPIPISQITIGVTNINDLIALWGEDELEVELLMPGFQEMLRLYEAEQFWDVSDKSFPWYYTFEGTRANITSEWGNFWNPDVNGGYLRHDVGYTSSLLSLLPAWNQVTNQRFADAFQRLRNGLMIYYGWEPSRFQ
ncbi:MAG: hypothetical protein U1C51_02040 [Candidatus Izemoplasmatales bacterium]|nr:hypothetical protein [bacterium]MDZ4196010.1 hypothetical protein [Candidatus Izemoplasmatales bacterium]